MAGGHNVPCIFPALHYYGQSLPVTRGIRASKLRVQTALKNYAEQERKANRSGKRFGGGLKLGKISGQHVPLARFIDTRLCLFWPPHKSRAPHALRREKSGFTDYTRFLFVTAEWERKQKVWFYQWIRTTLHRDTSRVRKKCSSCQRNSGEDVGMRSLTYYVHPEHNAGKCTVPVWFCVWT